MTAFVPTEADKAKKLWSAQAAACVALDYGATPDEVREVVEAGIAEIAARNATIAEAKRDADEAQARVDLMRREADAANERAAEWHREYEARDFARPSFRTGRHWDR